MRRITALILAVVLSVIFCGCTAHNKSEGVALIRIHVRANSNDSADQSVKLCVRDGVTKALSKWLSGVDEYERAYGIIAEKQDEIRKIARDVLSQNGFDYGASVRLSNEFFPTRSYMDVVVESGYYDALIIELGDGKGDNWWCVIYPPLCFQPTEGEFRYRSLIKELWERYLKKQEG